jgi:hypothetical protein
MDISLPADLDLADAKLAASAAFRRYYEISLGGDRQATFAALADWERSEKLVLELSRPDWLA